MDEEKLIEYLEEHRQDIIRDTADFIRIPSVSDDLVQVRKALEYALNLGQSLGFKAKSVLDGQVGVIEAGEGPETLGILSHVDVVPSGNINAWKTPPFEPVIKDGAIYGRGALDDKGAIIASLYAMKAVTVLDKPLKKKIQLILGTQEEVEWTDMDAYVREFPLPDYGFTPDGEFPLCNIEKGIMDIDLIVPLDSISGEGLFLKSINGGRAVNVIPDKCEAELIRRIRNSDGTYTEKSIKLTAEGTAVHSCQPEKGKNAIVNLCGILKEKDLADNNLSKLTNIIADRFSDLSCSGIGLYSKDEYYNDEYIHRNVVSVTVINTSADKVRVNFNVRFSYTTKKDEIYAVFEKIAGELGGKIGNVLYLPAVYISKDKPFMKVFAKAYETVSGLKNEFTLAYGGSYAKAMENIVSWGPIFPGEEDTCHEENEHIPIESLLLNAKIFSVAVGNIVLSEDSFK